MRAELARAHYRVGRITHEIGPAENSRQAYHKAIALWRELLEQQPDNLGFQEGLATSCLWSGRLQSDTGLGRPEDALQLLQEARVLYEHLGQEAPGNLAYQDGLAMSCDALANWYYENNRPAEEGGLREEALRSWQRLADKDPRFRRQVASAMAQPWLLLHQDRVGRRCPESLRAGTRHVDPSQREPACGPGNPASSCAAPRKHQPRLRALLPDAPRPEEAVRYFDLACRGRRGVGRQARTPS